MDIIQRLNEKAARERLLARANSKRIDDFPLLHAALVSGQIRVEDDNFVSTDDDGVVVSYGEAKLYHLRHEDAEYAAVEALLELIQEDCI